MKLCMSALIAAVFIVAAATLIPLFRSDDWWIRWFDFPRLQILILGILLIVLLIFSGMRASAFQTLLFIILLFSIGYQAYRIFPYTPFAGKQVKSAAPDEEGTVIRLVTANVRMHNRQSDKYLQVLSEAEPDIVLTTEVDQWWADSLKILDSSYPYQVKYPLENTYGMMLHSRFPLVNPSVKFLVEPMIPSIHCGIQLLGGQVIQFAGLHPRPPGPGESEDTTERDAELIIVGKSIKESDSPAMILGDLNDVAWSRSSTLFQKISGLLDPRIGRGMFNTYHADYMFIRFPLDHIFHSAHFKLIDMSRLSYIGSDHFPFYAALSFTPQRDASLKEPPAPTPGEKNEAQDILEKESEMRSE